MRTGPFKGLGWKFEHFETAEQLLERIHATGVPRADMVVVDINMESAGGKLKGTEAAALLAEDPARPRAVVICSGNGLDALAEVGTPDGSMPRGVDLVWAKPIPPQKQMLKDLRDVVSRRKPAGAAAAGAGASAGSDHGGAGSRSFLI